VFATLRDRLGQRLASVENKLTVRQQIGLGSAALCLVLVVVLTASAAYISRQQTRELITREISLLAKSMAGQLDIGMYDHYRDAELFVHMQPMQRVWTADRATIRGVLNGLQANRPEYTWIGFASADGTVVAASGGLLEGVSVAERPWFRAALKGPAVEDVHEAKLLATLLPDDGTGEPFRFVDIAFPIHADGRLVGVFGVHLSWQWASTLRGRILQRTAAPEGIDIQVLSRDGTVLLAQEVGSKPFSAEALETMRGARSGAFIDATGTGQYLTSFAVTSGYGDYPGLGWTVVARQPESTAFERARDLAWFIAWLAIPIALVGIAAALFIAGRVARPIHALTIDADRLGRDPSATMLPRQSGSKEVTQLSSALRSLLRRIGFEQQRSQEAELRASENAAQFADDLRALRKLADTDPLTNLMNRRAFLATAGDALAYFKRYQRPLAMLVIDIDHFKAVNDRYGHAAGDAAIKYVGERIESAVRATDKVARFGGEEFVVLLREVDELNARAFADRVRAVIESAAVTYGSDAIKLTVSIGVATANAADRDINDTIERADRGLYMAKNTGRNRVFFMPAETDVPSRHAA
jgi:diguanylate cyclase (GGDEF)-like protein